MRYYFVVGMWFEHINFHCKYFKEVIVKKIVSLCHVAEVYAGCCWVCGRLSLQTIVHRCSRKMAKTQAHKRCVIAGLPQKKRNCISVGRYKESDAPPDVKHLSYFKRHSEYIDALLKTDPHDSSHISGVTIFVKLCEAAIEMFGSPCNNSYRLHNSLLLWDPNM